MYNVVTNFKYHDYVYVSMYVYVCYYVVTNRCVTKVLKNTGPLLQ